MVSSSHHSSTHPTAVRSHLFIMKFSHFYVVLGCSAYRNYGSGSFWFTSFKVPFCFPSQRKQQELGDMMDLSSYLLRPIQRISKYNLLLQDILALAGSYRQQDMIQDPAIASSLCGPSAYVPDLASSEREREKAEIQAAADLVRFQMRHGNDLLTMDAIRDCDVRC